MPSAKNVIQVIINGKNNAIPAFKSATQMVTKFGVAATAALSAAAIRAGQFEKGMSEISTLLDGDTAPAIERMRGEILKLSVDFGQTMGNMTKARYDIISAGFTDAADSAAVLTAANKLAVAGVSDVAQTSDLLTTALNGLGLSASDAGAVSDVLFQTVRKGKTTITELAASFGPVFASARVAGIGLEELGGVMATITAAGIDTAEGATALSNLLRALAAPTGEAKDALASMGITLDDGLAPALQRLATVSDDGLAALARVIPNIRALKAAAVAASDINKLNSNLEAMADAAGVTENAFEAMGQTFDFQSKQARAALDALVTEVGTSVLPIFTLMVGKVRDVAVMIRFAATESKNGIPLWKKYGREMFDALPGARAMGAALGFVADRLQEMDKGLEQHAFNQQVTEVMKSWLKIPAIMDEFKIQRKFLPDSTDLVAMRKLAEEQVRARNAIQGEPKRDTFFDRLKQSANESADEIRKVIGEIQSEMDAAGRAAKPASEIITSGFGAGGADSGGVLFGPEAPKVLPDTEETEEQVYTLRDSLAELSRFTADDFASMAFNVGNAFADIATDVGAHMLGLTKGPIMLGRAFSQMAAGILNDIARIIARLLVAKALMSLFGGGGFVGGLAKGLGFSTGGTVPQAAFGMGVAGGGGLSMPAMIVPGSPGLDRSMVWAHGGEVMIPRREVEAIDRSRKRARTAPPPARRSRRGAGQVKVDVQAYRPFRREEQILLRDSVVEGLDRAERYRG